MRHGWLRLTRLAGAAVSLVLTGWLAAAGPLPAGLLAAGPFASGRAMAAPASSGSTKAEAATQALPSPSEILRRVQQALGALRDARARVEAEVLEASGRRVRSVVDAWVLRQPALVRLQMVEPATLADQVYVIDFEQRRVFVYLPVTHQVVIQPMDDRLPAGTGLGAFGPVLWLQPVPTQFEQSVRLIATDGQGSGLRYVLEGVIGPRRTSQAPTAAKGPPATGSRTDTLRGGLPSPGPTTDGLPATPPVVSGSEPAWWPSGKASTVQVWVNGSTWLAERLVAYDPSGREVASVVLRDLRVNTGLKPQDLRRLPEDAEVVQG